LLTFRQEQRSEEHALKSPGGGDQGYMSYNNGGGYQNYNTQEFKDEKEAFFSKKQQENSNRPEWVLL
jgi:ADP-ribosylation factor GTPase-activating protein 1